MFEYLEKHKKKLVYIPLIIYWLLLLTATSLPGSDMPDIHVSDKVEHFSGYAILTIFLTLAMLLQNKIKMLKEKAFIATLILVAVYGALDELHQLFIPGRDCDIYDWITDFSAACFGVVIVYFIVKYFRYKTRKA